MSYAMLASSIDLSSGRADSSYPLSTTRGMMLGPGVRQGSQLNAVSPVSCLAKDRLSYPIARWWIHICVSKIRALVYPTLARSAIRSRPKTPAAAATDDFCAICSEQPMPSTNAPGTGLKKTLLGPFPSLACATADSGGVKIWTTRSP